ncbi:FitA-like ribbon-helix-helix domain-containing protein [Amycolatopsis pithecellobii]|uniref:Antitoxin n=1 Tax=Amycolatopsis pithecellobii TaxID=664692 RepID=A0A6N7YPM4_9PSEU|nr:antitoxin [Amycolatopsis pithecellobii]MTD53952.1 antitoxin [Amycolatopsis pithecellobii]
MATIQIRDVPIEAYEAIRDAAKAEGKSLQAYMREQTTVIAQRARKKAALDTVREMLSKDTGTGVTRESILEDLRAVRGPWPDEEDSPR